MEIEPWISMFFAFVLISALGFLVARLTARVEKLESEVAAYAAGSRQETKARESQVPPSAASPLGRQSS